MRTDDTEPKIRTLGSFWADTRNIFFLINLVEIITKYSLQQQQFI